MRHKRQKKYLGRNPSHRKAMLSNLVTSLFENGRIQTTEAKAKEGRRLAERLITFARKGDLHSRRQVVKSVCSKRAVKRLFDEIGPRFSDRKGGYTRIIKLGSRLGDRASLVLFEVIGEPVATETKDAKKATGAKKVVREAVKRVKGKRSTKTKEAAAIAPSKSSAGKEGKVKKETAIADS